MIGEDDKEELGKLLQDALDSALSQTFEDFEILISDNASTDSTPEIAAEYCARDSRVRYHRQETNLGAAANFNYVFHHTTGEFFHWSSYDDMLAPEYLEACVAALGVWLVRIATGTQITVTAMVDTKTRPANMLSFAPSASTRSGIQMSVAVATTIVATIATNSVSALTRHQNQRAIMTVPRPAPNTPRNLKASRMLGIRVVEIKAATVSNTIVIRATSTYSRCPWPGRTIVGGRHG